MQQDLINVNQCAKWLCLSKPMIYKMVTHKKIPAIIMQGVDPQGRGKRIIRFEPDKIRDFIEQRRVNY